jgi:hypothetical protein
MIFLKLVHILGHHKLWTGVKSCLIAISVQIKNVDKKMFLQVNLKMVVVQFTQAIKLQICKNKNPWCVFLNHKILNWKCNSALKLDTIIPLWHNDSDDVSHQPYRQQCRSVYFSLCSPALNWRLCPLMIGWDIPCGHFAFWWHLTVIDWGSNLCSRIINWEERAKAVLKSVTEH